MAKAKSFSVHTEPLAFISDQKLAEHARAVISKARVAASRQNIYINVIDPFSAIFDAAQQGISLEEWLAQEKSRQAQKSLQNLIGDFHQSVLGSVPGWENLLAGGSIDIRSRDKKVIAEIKNKYNTMNSGSQLGVYDKLQKHLDYDESYRGYTAYCVVIVPKNPVPMNTTFHPSERGTRRPVRDDIRIIDGRSFYQLVTGDGEAMQKLYYRLLLLISGILGSQPEDFMSSSIFSDLFEKAYIKK